MSRDIASATMNRATIFPSLCGSFSFSPRPLSLSLFFFRLLGSLTNVDMLRIHDTLVRTYYYPCILAFVSIRTLSEYVPGLNFLFTNYYIRYLQIEAYISNSKIYTVIIEF